ncbi:hypothetical protein BD324DRAFT_628204 [Kockovaella imperatae]|uniref:Uncharacterized protein n=1 Tax=Kockovaella imperatae TaxID=4999 RepID=A0A1Y1UFK8_9TREE|nr:hypothetical protein BD324DRAFT_628204 [Kockovaella imperatae]ORX36294.1 hypothetical protein BD324DRAFT_628204 [Kockovaella imperatae]
MSCAVSVSCSSRRGFIFCLASSSQRPVVPCSLPTAFPGTTSRRTMSSSANYTPSAKRFGKVSEPEATTGGTPSSFSRKRRDPPFRHESNVRTEFSREDLLRHFGHPHDGTVNFFGYLNRTGKSPSRIQIDAEFVSKIEKTSSEDGHPGRALERPPPPDSPPHPLSTIISNVLVFHNSQPAWRSNGELWLHSGAEHLTKDWHGPRKNIGRPIPIFQGMLGRKLFEFAGWWLLDRIEEVSPRSEALLEILETKQASFSYRRGRTPAAWTQALDATWLKLFFKPAPASSDHYTELRSPLSLKGLLDNEVERYMLQVGGLKDELELLEETVQQRRKGLLAFIDSNTRVRT